MAIFLTVLARAIFRNQPKVYGEAFPQIADDFWL